MEVSGRALLGRLPFSFPGGLLTQGLNYRYQHYPGRHFNLCYRNPKGKTQETATGPQGQQHGMAGHSPILPQNSVSLREARTVHQQQVGSSGCFDVTQAKLSDSSGCSQHQTSEASLAAYPHHYIWENRGDRNPKTRTILQRDSLELKETLRRLFKLCRLALVELNLNHLSELPKPPLPPHKLFTQRIPEAVFFFALCTPRHEIARGISTFLAGKW